ncbi:MAG TPA: bifunctional methylenetetrahydrofolate dehydrogenase/methenyltetrahydrofolate cyclohydrolase FolD [Xanthobacteraceae bacterium]|nr:bifunctional methylenetetrahydrofolate dehydrogenase/methenyltetrahydrofolate cyclohydrolase FolD [Xanthobacteraceae bacterium]
MSARIIDGFAAAAALTTRIAAEVERLAREHKLAPGLAVVLVGDDPASTIYVRSKVKRTAESGMRSFDHRLPGNVSEKELIGVIERLNADQDVHAILVQLPLPAHIDATKIVAAIDPSKDADGLHPLNAGLLSAGLATLVPCTPRGCIMLAKSVHPSLTGLEAVVVGRSGIVGKPLAQLLLAENATVTVAHSKTADLAGVCRRADLLFAAVGRPELIRGDWIKPGATVIDVGINRLPKEGGKTRLAGDVAFAEAQRVAGAITPVPRGVGPMTIACLLLNTLIAACTHAGLPPPALN